MREIKFRAWCSNSHEMDYSDSYLDRLVGFFCHNEGCDNIMQYTGFKDHNYKEIYEGDIVSCPGDYEMLLASLGKDSFRTGVIKWVDSWASFLVFIDWHFGKISDLTCGRMSVIGNIHQNPELLEQSK
jgi:uncharacterized phage protein (TIGR01671 family)